MFMGFSRESVAHVAKKMKKRREGSLNQFIMPLHHFEEAQSNDVITLEKEQVEIITKVKVIKKSNTQARIFDQNYVAIKK